MIGKGGTTLNADREVNTWPRGNRYCDLKMAGLHDHGTVQVRLLLCTGLYRSGHEAEKNGLI